MQPEVAEEPDAVPQEEEVLRLEVLQEEAVASAEEHHEVVAALAGALQEAEAAALVVAASEVVAEGEALTSLSGRIMCLCMQEAF